MRITTWTVDYGDGPRPVQIPHAWRQEVPVSWEGPALYRTTIKEVKPGQHLQFEGVSYEAIVRANGTEIGQHRGIWDAFSFPVPAGNDLEIEVEVRKNGGDTFPVKDVASGFLPFVFHTFGGIYKGVSLVDEEPSLRPSNEDDQCVSAEGTKLRGPDLVPAPTIQDRAQAWLKRNSGEQIENLKSKIENSPLYLRGVLSWGWYPEIGHCNPPDEVIRREIEVTKNLGFNLIKFCLWVPSHRYLELMHESGLWAWIELPLWDPTSDADRQDEMALELERIVDQYAHHPNVALWTCGCELHESTSARFRQRLYEMVKDKTGALVKDNSGSAEMYGGDLREYGDFYDFHPYCDLPFYPEVLDSLLVGPRPKQPILLGEFNDIDVHRDLAKVVQDNPYWASSDPTLNAQGVRWQYDLPGLLPENRFANHPNEHRHEALMASSLTKARFMRKYVQEAVRARGDIAGYVVTGWRDTPISSAGMIDDWDKSRFTADDLASWNGPACLFIIPTRRPPWVHGGNRPGWIDPFNHFTGRVFWRIGVHCETDLEGMFEWDVVHVSWDGGQRPRGRVAYGTSESALAGACQPAEIGQIAWDAEKPGGYLLRVRFGGAENSWPIWVVPAPSDEDRTAPEVEPPLTCMTKEGTVPMPFWRESAYEFHDAAFWEHLGYREKWERLLPLTPDRGLELKAIYERHPSYDWSVLLNRIDVRTYVEHPILMRGSKGNDQIFVTTLRPHGGLGNTPSGLLRNPSGLEFVRKLRSLT